MGAVSRVDVAWIAHPDAALAGRDDALAPDLSIWIAGGARTRAVLVPSALHVIVPFHVACTIQGMEPHALDPVEPDPLFPHLSARAPLGGLRGRQRVRLFGVEPDRFLEMRLPLAIDRSQQLAAVVLGEPFFRAARCMLDTNGISWLEQSPGTGA